MHPLLYDSTMSKVVQIRDVPDEVHDALAKIARAQGVSLTRYLQGELEHLAMRNRVVEHNASTIRATQGRIRSSPDRATILSVLHQGRPD